MHDNVTKPNQTFAQVQGWIWRNKQKSQETECGESKHGEPECGKFKCGESEHGELKHGGPECGKPEPRKHGH